MHTFVVVIVSRHVVTGAACVADLHVLLQSMPCIAAIHCCHTLLIIGNDVAAYATADCPCAVLRLPIQVLVLLILRHTAIAATADVITDGQ